MEITELPIRRWTQDYKEQVLEVLLHGSEKVEPFIRYTSTDWEREQGGREEPVYTKDHWQHMLNYSGTSLYCMCLPNVDNVYKVPLAIGHLTVGMAAKVHVLSCHCMYSDSGVGVTS